MSYNDAFEPSLTTHSSAKSHPQPQMDPFLFSDLPAFQDDNGVPSSSVTYAISSNRFFNDMPSGTVSGMGPRNNHDLESTNQENLMFVGETMTSIPEHQFKPALPTNLDNITPGPYPRKRKFTNPGDYISLVKRARTATAERSIALGTPSNGFDSWASTTENIREVFNLESQIETTQEEEQFGSGSKLDFMDYLNNPEKYGMGGTWGGFEPNEGDKPLDENYFDM